MIGAHVIFGANPEPFLEAALQSVGWVDYYAAVNTAPDDGKAAQNEAVFRRVVPREKQRLARVACGLGANFNFGQARNACLDLAEVNDYVLILDSDDVHYPDFETQARLAVAQGFDIITAHFWHLIGYKDLWGKEPHREILFTRDGASFTKAVHEGLDHPRRRPHLLPDYHYVHYGYIKPPREIFRRWVLYSQIEGDPHHYDGRNPDDALAGWLDNTNPFLADHPPAVRETLEAYPTAPRSARALPEGTPRNIGLVLLTWDDADNLKLCLKSLARTRQPFKLVVVDNGSLDFTLPQLAAFMDHRGEHEGTADRIYHAGLGDRPASWSLAQALNIGFEHFMEDPEIDYIGWIHPDMVFERDTWLECLRHALDTHPDIAKIGAAEMGAPIHPDPCPGNSQCYLVRKSALQKVGLFDERFQACGGYEDWEHNWRLINQAGKVMIWPDALIRHNAMGTRKKHDNVEAARHNAEVYHSIVGTWNAVV